MRSALLVFLLGVACVQAHVRPGYNHHHHHQEDCDEPSTSTTPEPTTTETTTEATTTETTTEPTTRETTTTPPACPTGFALFVRTPNANNSETSLWCLYAAIQQNPINISSAPELCAAHSGAVLSNVANAAEKEFVTAQLLAAVKSYGYSAGAIAVDGRRNKECVSRNKTVLATYPCSDQTLVYSMTDKHTDPAYAWTQWAADEPSANAWTYDIEECLQLAVVPAKPKRDNLLNDIYCNFIQAPNDPNNTLYWNFGALCGVAPQ